MAERLTESGLEAIRARVDATGGGPWLGATLADQEFFEDAPTDVRRLLAEVDALRADLARVTAELDGYKSAPKTLRDVPRPTEPVYPKMDFVCFASAFAYESAPNITHMTLDGERTACGRSGWVTTEGTWKAGPDCRRCRMTFERLPACVRDNELAPVTERREGCAPTRPTEPDLNG